MNDTYFKGNNKYVDEYRKNLEELHSLEKTIISDKKDEITKIYKGMQKAAVEYYDAQIESIEKLRTARDVEIEQLKEELALMEKRKVDYDKVVSTVVDALDKEIEKLNELSKARDKDIEQLNETLKLLEEQKSSYDKIISTVVDVLDDEIEKLNELSKARDKEIEQLNEILELNEKQKSDYDRTISAVANVVDEEIKRLQKQKKALQEVNQEQEKKIELAELEEKVRLARENRSVLIYREGIGFQYEQNLEAVEEAKKAISDFKFQEQLDLIDEQIEGWEKYKEQWTSVADVFQTEQDRIIAAQQLGANWERLILDQRIDVVKNFQKDYTNLEEMIENDIKKQIEALELEKKELQKNTDSKIEEIEKYKEQWTSLANAVEIEQNKIITAQQFGANWENLILEQRLDVFEDFQKDYYNLNVKIENDIKKQIESLELEKTELQKNTEAKIADIEKYKEQWTSLSSVIETEQNKIITAQQLGFDWESKILDLRIETLKDFEVQYLELNSLIENDVKVRIESLEDETKQVTKNTEQQLQDLQDLRDGWSNALNIDDDIIEYKGSLESLLGAENSSYSERLTALNKFISDYNKALSSMDSYKPTTDTSYYTSSGTPSSSSSTTSSTETGGYAGSQYKETQTSTTKKPNINDGVEYEILGETQTSSGSGTLLHLYDPKTKKDYMVDEAEFMNWKKYAKGTMNAVRGIANVDELGEELIIRKPIQGRFTRLEKGDGVIPADLTKNLFAIASNPIDFMKESLKNIISAPRHSFVSNKSIQPTNIINIGDVHAHNVKDSNDFAKDIKSNFGNQMLQDFFGKN